MSGHRRSKIVFVAIGICLVVLAATVEVAWIVVHWRTLLLMIFGALVFALIIAGVVLNTIFLVREIRRNEQHDAFINAVTHELKTPIASIRLYLETLQKRPIEEHQRQEFYSVMLEDSDRLLVTVEQVLRAGRTSRRKLDHERINLPDLVAECVDLVRIRHHLTRDAVGFETRCARAEILGEPDELRAAVTNLLDNAIKYSGHDIRVDVCCETPDEKRVLVRVKDQGVGISEVELKRIFRRFYRIPGGIARRVKGTGLGLFIVRSVARRHGGRAFAESAGVGFGSTFTLQFPIAPK
jgi:two-component system, OmpR family, sensor histidine kinase SenX3